MAFSSICLFAVSVKVSWPLLVEKDFCGKYLIIISCTYSEAHKSLVSPFISSYFARKGGIELLKRAQTYTEIQYKIPSFMTKSYTTGWNAALNHAKASTVIGCRHYRLNSRWTLGPDASLRSCVKSSLDLFPALSTYLSHTWHFFFCPPFVQFSHIFWHTQHHADIWQLFS